VKLEKAIEILQDDYQHHHNIQDPLPAIAIMLGIEALKRHRDNEEHPRNGMPNPLPSETTD